MTAILPGTSYSTVDAPGIVLEVRDLCVEFAVPGRTVRAVEGLDLVLPAGGTIGIAGESGCGKSALCLALLGLHAPAATVRGSIQIAGQEMIGAGAEKLEAVRGNVASMIFQDPAAALHPYKTVGSQIAEAYRAHRYGGRRAGRHVAVEMLERVGVDRPSRRARQYPHELSGGMRQRVMIAMAMCTRPSLLIADEPTTALDVTVQAQILTLMRELQRECGTALVLVSHDLAVLAQLADEVMVMYAGRAVEHGATVEVLGNPAHPYTRGLLDAVVRVDRTRVRRLPVIPGSPPPAGAPPDPCCAFAPRCSYAGRTQGRAATELPALIERGDGHPVACHLDAQQRDPAPSAVDGES